MWLISLNSVCIPSVCRTQPRAAAAIDTGHCNVVELETLATTSCVSFVSRLESLCTHDGCTPPMHRGTLSGAACRPGPLHTVDPSATDTPLQTTTVVRPGYVSHVCVFRHWCYVVMPDDELQSSHLNHTLQTYALAKVPRQKQICDQMRRV